MPCSRSACRPSVRSAKSISGRVPTRALSVAQRSRAGLRRATCASCKQAADEGRLAVVDAAARSRSAGGPSARTAQGSSRMRWRVGGSPCSEVALALLLLHRAVGVVVDDARGALGGARATISSMISVDVRRLRAHGARSRDSSRACGSGTMTCSTFSPGCGRALRRPHVIEDDELPAAHHHLALAAK